MIVDISTLRSQLHKMVGTEIDGCATGDFYENGVFSVARFERQRGRIEGIHAVLGLLEQPIAGTQPEEAMGDDETAS